MEHVENADAVSRQFARGGPSILTRIQTRCSVNLNLSKSATVATFLMFDRDELSSYRNGCVWWCALEGKVGGNTTLDFRPITRKATKQSSKRDCQVWIQPMQVGPQSWKQGGAPHGQPNETFQVPTFSWKLSHVFGGEELVPAFSFVCHDVATLVQTPSQSKLDYDTAHISSNYMGCC